MNIKWLLVEPLRCKLWLDRLHEIGLCVFFFTHKYALRLRLTVSRAIWQSDSFSTEMKMRFDALYNSLCNKDDDIYSNSVRMFGFFLRVSKMKLHSRELSFGVWMSPKAVCAGRVMKWVDLHKYLLDTNRVTKNGITPNDNANRHNIIHFVL